MTDDDRLKLLHGPYVPPACKRGDVLRCEMRDREVKVGGMSNGLIQWPTALKTGRPSLILCGDLVRAVKTESEIAVSHWWGVNIVVVWGWRKALGVTRVNEGTNRLYREYKPDKLPEDIVAIGRANARKPEVIERLRSSRRGKPAHPNTAKALREAASRPWSEERKRRLSARLRANPIGGEDPNRPRWTPEEDAILGTAPDRVIAERLDRTLRGTRARRQNLGIPAYHASRDTHQD